MKNKKSVKSSSKTSSKVRLKLSRWIPLVVILIVVSTAYFLTKNILNPTANWKTYANKELSFSIKYPKEWEINDRCSSISGNKQYEQIQLLCTLDIYSDSHKTSVGAPIIDVNPDAPNSSLVLVHVYSNPKNLDTEKFVISKEGLNRGALVTVSKEKKGNNDFIKESYNKHSKNNDIASLGSFYINGGEGKAFRIFGTIFAKDGAYQKMPLSEINKYRDIYEQMLSTFKLTK